MVDMSPTILAKSDQVTADDLISGPRTITVTRVTGNEGNSDQPVNVWFEGDNGKPFRPCKSMRRVMVKVWGADSSKYAGRSLTIYRDPKVKWGGMEVGGVRISHMTELNEPLKVALQVTRGKKAATVVKPLNQSDLEKGDPAKDAADKIISNISRAPSLEKLDAYIEGKPSEAMKNWQDDRPELVAAVQTVLDRKRADLTTDDDNPFGENA